MTTRQRFQAITKFQPFDRLPVLEWAGWWNKTRDRWYGEGLPKELTDRYEICEHFGLDLYMQDWIRAYTPECPEPTSHGAGIIQTNEDYERVLPHLYPASALVVERWQERERLQSQGKAVLWFSVDGFFWFARRLLGIERHLYSFYDQADLVKRINSDLANWVLRLVDQICEICVPDFMTFAEDMSYNNGPMLSKEIFDEFLRPFYDRVVPVLKEKGIIPIADSDGNVHGLAPWLEEAGLKGILPLERQAKVDIHVLRQAHPNMIFVGHFDKRVMSKGEEAIRAEFERLIPVAAKGGFLVGCDHQTPPEVSYSDYQLYSALFREYADRAGGISRELLT